MHPGATEAFIKRLLEIVKNITIISSSSDMDNLLGHHNVVIEKGIYLVDDNIARFEKLFESIWDKLNGSEKFSQDAVEKKLKQLISRIVKEGNSANVGIYFNQFMEYYENYSIEQKFYVPMVNIEMHGIDKLEIGRVTIKRMTDKEIAGIARKIKKTISRTAHSPEAKPLILDTLLKQEVEPLRGQICAEFRIVAEAELVEELARKEISHILDLLRYAIPNIYPHQYPMYWCPPQDRKRVSQTIKKESSQHHTRIGFGVQGEVGIGNLNTVTVSSNGDEFHFKYSFIGMRPFILSPENIAILKRIGVFKIARLLKKGNLTSLEDAISRSIHWYANSLIQVELENELLSLVTSLETLLTSSGNLMDEVGYGIAFLLGTNVDSRLDLMNRYKEIYNKRSKTTHHGHRNVDEIDLIELRYLAFFVIIAVIKNLNKWKEHDQLFNWIKRRKLQ